MPLLLTPPMAPPRAARSPCQACGVREHVLFASLGGEQLAQQPVRPGWTGPEQALLARGHRGRFVYTIRSGLVRLERVTARGDTRVVRLAGRGDLVGLEALLGLPHADDAVACTPVEACAIAVDEIERLASEVGSLRQDLMLRWQRSLDAASSWSAEMCTGPARRRLLKLLEMLLPHADADGTLWLPRRELMGAMLDIALETASRLVSQLRQEGVLEPLPRQAARVDGERLAHALAAADR